MSVFICDEKGKWGSDGEGAGYLNHSDDGLLDFRHYSKETDDYLATFVENSLAAIVFALLELITGLQTSLLSCVPSFLPYYFIIY